VTAGRETRGRLEHARQHAAFFQNLDQANLAGSSRVRPAAEFGGEGADADIAQKLFTAKVAKKGRKDR
jgi:hypothetical protein